jgi:hypothetical protein
LSLSLKEERRLEVLENKEMRKLERRGDEEREGWRKLHNEELPNLLFANYSYSGQVREDEMGSAFSLHRHM